MVPTELRTLYYLCLLDGMIRFHPAKDYEVWHYYLYAEWNKEVVTITQAIDSILKDLGV